MGMRGCKVIITSINMTEAVKAKQDIIYKTGNSQVSAIYLDLCSFKGIRRFATQLKNNIKVLDILINNAGVGGPNRLTITEDGIETQMQTNYFGPMLLTLLLLEVLKKSNYGR